MLSVSGCVSDTQIPTTPKVVDTACLWVNVIRIHNDDYKLMDIRTLRTIDAHNQAVEKNCPKESK